MLEQIGTFLYDLPHLTVQGVIEILILAYVIYKAWHWVEESRAENIIKGIFVLLCFAFLAYLLGFRAIWWVIEKLTGVVTLALVLLFQNEIKQVLERIGRKKWFSKLFKGVHANTIINEKTIREVAKATFQMASVKTGALIVMCKEETLKYIIDTGIEINGKVSSQLLINIFEKNTPLHDGAVVIDMDIVKAATCYLPLSDSFNISKDLGTRHRAALGMSEQSDSITVVVSEETGKVRIAENGTFREIKTEEDLTRDLFQCFSVDNKKDTEEEVKEDGKAN